MSGADNFYNLLHVDRNATKDDIRIAIAESRIKCTPKSSDCQKRRQMMNLKLVGLEDADKILLNLKKENELLWRTSRTGPETL